MNLTRKDGSPSQEGDIILCTEDGIFTQPQLPTFNERLYIIEEKLNNIENLIKKLNNPYRNHCGGPL